MNNALRVQESYGLDKLGRNGSGYGQLKEPHGWRIFGISYTHPCGLCDEAFVLAIRPTDKELIHWKRNDCLPRMGLFAALS